MITEQHVKLAAKLCQCRDTAKKLYREKYNDHIGDYMGFIKAAMLKHNYKDEITAAMRLISDCSEMEGAGVATMNIMAACVELIEPSPPSK